MSFQGTKAIFLKATIAYIYYLILTMAQEHFFVNEIAVAFAAIDDKRHVAKAQTTLLSPPLKLFWVTFPSKKTHHFHFIDSAKPHTMPSTISLFKFSALDLFLFFNIGSVIS